MKYTAENMLIRSQDSGGPGVFARVRAEEAGWDYLNMAALRLNRGEKFGDSTGHHENALVIPGGVRHVRSKIGRATCRDGARMWHDGAWSATFRVRGA